MRSQPKHSTILKQIAALRAKHGKDRSGARAFPNLRVEHNVAPLGNQLGGSTAAKAPIEGAFPFTVSHLPKQGYMLISRDDIKFLGDKRNI